MRSLEITLTFEQIMRRPSAGEIGFFDFYIIPLG